MNNRNVLTVLILATCAVMSTARMAAASFFNPTLQVDCGSSNGATGTYVSVGIKCTSNQGGCNQTNKDRARAEANETFVNWINSSHQCKTCIMGEPPASYVCSETITITPTGGYADADCVCHIGASGCEGNPLKTEIVQTCTASITWLYSCDNPCDQ